MKIFLVNLEFLFFTLFSSFGKKKKNLKILVLAYEKLFLNDFPCIENSSDLER